LDDLGLDGRILLNGSYRNMERSYGLDSVPLVESFEDGNELLSSIKGGEVFDYLSVCYILKRDSDPWC
jgi:hypothetical protein